ncbi:MAG: VWA domain-containing protein [Ilumatobacter sp.]|nr:VWA domain-containing protein [Ilumatobacter sp.]
MGSNILVAVVLALTWLVPSAGHVRAQAPAPEQSPDQSEAQTVAAVDTADEAQPGQPVFRSGINFVRVDAIVTDDDGNAVDDLTIDDFEVYEDDLLQQVETFKLIEHTGEFDPALPPPSSIRNEYDLEREAAREDSRIFVFFLDDYHVRDYNAVRMTQPLIDFVENDLTPTDLVGIMYPLTPTFDVTLTRDHAQIVNALERFKGRKYNYQAQNSYEQQYVYYPTTDVEKIRNDVSLSALKALAMKLGGLREGRKSIIVLSEGYSDYVPPQLRDQSAGGQGMRSAMRYNPQAGMSRNESTQALFQDMGMRSNLVYTADIANRNNTSFYMVDPRGLAVWEYDLSTVPIDHETDQRMLRNLQETLYVLADESDGRAILNRNDIGPGLAQVAADQTSYYLLGYTSIAAPTDGEFHEIKVRVKRPDVKIRARKGYYALTDANAARILAPPKPEAPKEVDVALSTLAEPIRGRLVRTWVGASRADNGKTQLTFVWEPVGNAQSRRGETASQVTLMAMSDDAAYFRGDVPARSATSVPRATFEADPGQVELNVAIEDEYGDVVDRAVEELDVPDFTGPEVALSTPALFRAQNAMQMKQIVSDPDALPTAGRYFLSDDQLLVRVEAYAPGDDAVVTARLLSREGTSIIDLPMGGSAGDVAEFSVALSPYPRGDYLIEITAAAGEEQATTLLAFRIQG